MRTNARPGVTALPASTLGAAVALIVIGLAVTLQARAEVTTVRVGVHDSPPLCSTERTSGDDGLLTSILSETARKERWHVVYIPGTLSELLERLDRGEIDLLVGAPYTKEYAQRYQFSRESVVSTWAQIYSAGPARLETPLDLQSLNVGIMRDDLYNSTMREMASSYNIRCTFVEFNDYQEVFNALDKGWIDAGIVDHLNAALHEDRHRAVRTNVFFAPIEIRFAVKKFQNENLVNALDYHLGILKGDPHSLYYTILNRITRVKDDSRLLKKMKWGLAAAAVFLLLLLAVNFILRRQVRRKTAELLESEERYRSVFQNTGTATIIVEQDGTISMVNARMEELSGYPCREIEGRMKTGDFVHPDDMGRVEALRKAGEESGRTREEFEVRMVDRRWNVKDIIVKESTIPETRQRVVSLIDITERKRSGEELLRLATAIEQSTESVIITDTRRVIRYVNPVFREITGYSTEEIIGKTTDILLSGETPSQAHEPSGFPDSVDCSWRGRITNVKKDGTRYRTETRISPIRDASGTVMNYVITQRDVSNEELLETQLRQSQKMEAIGALAGGIAHDFNNILSPIIGFSELALTDLPAASPPANKLKKILQSAERAKDLVNQILTFSRQREQEVKPVDMRDIVEEALKLIRATIPSTIDIVPSIPPDGGIVLGDVIQIHQVLVNLCTNASHAMQGTGGVLEVRLENVEIDEESSSRYLNMSPGPYVCLTVSDTGCGMDKATLERIFEPFFTTKKREGTGLGLAIVHGIVKGMNGWINVYSEPGQGTTFKIHLPRVDRDADEEVVHVDTMLGGTETILYVDDEVFITEMAREMLEAFGYRVEPRTSSIEALKAFRAKPDRFDLIITDQTMPNMTGLDLIREVHSIRGDIPVILCTGFSESVTNERAKGTGISEIIYKPFIKKDFLKAVRRVIDKPRAGGEGKDTASRQ